jgi:uncharacterized phage protein gp47/JayE
MPFERPTLTALAQQARADLAGSTSAWAILRASPLGVLAKVVSGLVNGLYGYLDWIARMAVPITAEGEYLLAWAALKGVEIKGAEFATGTATFTGSPDAILPNGTRIARDADGVGYVTTEIATIGVGGTLTVPIQAEVAGAVGNALASAAVSIAAAVSGVVAGGVLAAPASGGADEELIPVYRERMLERYRTPPQGGALSDYEAWAEEVPGVTRAWSARTAEGVVSVWVMLDDARATASGFPQGTNGVATDETRGTPATGDQLLVANYIYPRRPATALVQVLAPLVYAIPITITGLSTDTVEIRAAVVTALKGMLRRDGRPGGTIYPSDIAAAIASVAGVEHFSLTAPTAPAVASAGYLPQLGTLTWITPP